ncbi:hypothetical protein D3C77_618950 [compost metagenome]
MVQVRVITRGIAQRTAVGRKCAGGDADAVGIGLTGQHRVLEYQRGSSGSRDIISVNRAATDIQRQARRATSGIDHRRLVHGHGDTDKVTGIQGAALHTAGTGDRHRADTGGRGIH